MDQSKKNKITTIIMFVLILALIGGMVFCIVKLTSTETTKSVSALNFQIGNLSADGTVNKNDTSTMVTKNYLKLDNLSIELPEGSGVQYKVFYFDDNGAVVGVDEYSTSAYSAEAPEGATQVKIVVDPLLDSEISFFEIMKYAKQIKITVAK